jgi:TolA-binding protein
MKKLLSLTILILIASILLTSCGNDEYAIERQYYLIKKRTEKIYKNPNASPPNQLEKTVGILNKFIKKYPKDKFSIEAAFEIARLYMVKEEYDRARAQLKAIIDKYPKSANISAESLFFIGNTYQIQDKWALALEQYKKIMREYPATVRGLGIPVYIAQYYKVHYQPDKMLLAFQEAIGHYKALAGKYPNTALAYQAHKLVADCYIALKDWPNVINSFNTIMNTYKGKVRLDGAILSMAAIYSRELKDMAKAKELLNQLIKEYPQSRLVKTATLMLKELNKK